MVIVMEEVVVMMKVMMVMVMRMRIVMVVIHGDMVSGMWNMRGYFA